MCLPSYCVTVGSNMLFSSSFNIQMQYFLAFSHDFSALCRLGTKSTYKIYYPSIAEDWDYIAFKRLIGHRMSIKLSQKYQY